ncbi:hypothetical protein [Methylobacterium sp. CCH5-D2]|uniref:hypothetical protein n=1 Tax=Methylobacterium sp. CCH5-D2 TaxID=1768765 RepID=UPI000A8B57F7|nr:hypothetical protein [Methylobacterium sp. CCH5-D2]
MSEAAPKTDAQIVTEVNDLARKMLAYLGVGFTAPPGFKFYEADEREWRAREAWRRAAEVYEWITGTEVHDALLAFQEEGDPVAETAARHETIARALCKAHHPDRDPDEIQADFDPPIRLWHGYLKAAAAADEALATREAAQA